MVPTDWRSNRKKKKKKQWFLVSWAKPLQCNTVITQPRPCQKKKKQTNKPDPAGHCQKIKNKLKT
jgi:hypothetical protein